MKVHVFALWLGVFWGMQTQAVSAQESMETDSEYFELEQESDITPLITVPLPQTLRFKHLLDQGEVSIGEVLAFAEDKYGFMWIGGKLGLLRYDGQRFEEFAHDPSLANSLPSNTVNDLAIDMQGKLWIATNNGLACYNYATGQFDIFRHDASNPNSLSANIVYHIRFDNHGNMWLATREGLDLFNPYQKTITRYPRQDDDPDLYTAYTMDIAQDHDGVYYLGTGYGFKVWDAEANEVTHYEADKTRRDTLQVGLVRTVFIDSQNRVWAGTEKGLFQFLRETKNFKLYPTDLDPEDATISAAVWDIIEDSQGTLWVATDKHGLAHLNPNEQKLITATQYRAVADSISSDVIRRVYEDRSQNIWTGTQPGVISIFDRAISSFDHLSEHGLYALNESHVRSFLEHENGELWVGTDGGGVNIIDFESKRIREMRAEAGNDNSLSSNDVLSIEIDHQGDIWFAKWNTALSVLTPKTGKFRHYDHIPQDPHSISNTHTWKVFQASNGDLWVATIGSGLDRYDRAQDHFVNYIHSTNNPMSLADDLVWDITEDKNGKIWVATENGLSLYQPEADEFINFVHRKDDPGSLPSNQVLSLHIDSHNHLWVGTRESGLHRFDGEKFSSIDVARGLVSNVIQSITEDEKGNIWVSTDKGLSRYTPATGEIKNFKQRDGVQPGPFSTGAAIKLDNGKLAFGGTQGITLFHPEQLWQSEYVAPVRITGLKVQDTEQKAGAANSVLNQSIFLTEKITLQHEQNMFTIEFAALDFRSPDESQYAYKLDGFDTDWHYLTDDNRATYTNLDSGHYLFRVKAATREGVWNEIEANLAIHIIPPSWRSWWAYSLYALSLAGLLLGYFASLKKTNLRLEREVIARTQALVRANEKLEQLVVEDLDTGLGNPRLLDHIVITDAAASLRQYRAHLNNSHLADIQTADMVFYFVQVKNLAAIRADYGDEIAQKYVIEYSLLLKDVMRESDYIIHWDDDRFLITSRHLTRYQADKLAMRIVRATEHNLLNIDEHLELTCPSSVGFACFPFNLQVPEHYSWKTTLDIADLARQLAHDSGTNQWIGFLSTAEKAYSMPEIIQFAQDQKITIETSLNGINAINWNKD